MILVSCRELKEHAIQHSNEKLFQHQINSWVDPRVIWPFSGSYQGEETSQYRNKKQMLVLKMKQMKDWPSHLCELVFILKCITAESHHFLINYWNWYQWPLAFIESACMIKACGSHFPFFPPWLFLLVPSFYLSNNNCYY